jgi:transcriptional regulator with XRE-family HTH domain
LLPPLPDLSILLKGMFPTDALRLIVASQVEERLSELTATLARQEREEAAPTQRNQLVVSTVKECATALNLDVIDVLKATGIAKSSYSQWAKQEMEPRLQSQGTLWLLAQAVTSLVAVAPGGAGPWLHAEPWRLAALHAGKFDELVAAAARQALDEDTSPGAILARADRGRIASPPQLAALAVGAEAPVEDAVALLARPRRGTGRGINSGKRRRETGPSPE